MRPEPHESTVRVQGTTPGTVSTRSPALESSRTATAPRPNSMLYYSGMAVSTKMPKTLSAEEQLTCPKLFLGFFLLNQLLGRKAENAIGQGIFNPNQTPTTRILATSTFRLLPAP